MLDKKVLEDSFLSLLDEVHPKILIKKQCKFTSEKFYINNHSLDIPKDKKVYV